MQKKEIQYKRTEFQRQKYLYLIYSYLFFFCSTVHSTHIRNPTHATMNERPINHRDTRINVSYHPRSGNAIIWKLMATGLLNHRADVCA